LWSVIRGYRRTENRIRHFERLQRQPERFLVIGDAACTFNPIYGQGMTTAALGAMTLRECLYQCRDKNLSGLPHRFQRKLAHMNASPWALATATDIRVPGVEGGNIHWINKWQYAYLDRFLQLLPTDSALASTFIKVVHMVEAPTKLFSPSVGIKVLLKPRPL
jgi:2-polyprenyl-6-methoxyphenol hydroxylase-like FAD-dependent oxidoreductase